MLEAEIERALVTRVKKAGGFTPKFISPGNAGAPDRLVLMPGGNLAFIELKAPGKKPRPLQLAWHKRLRTMGFRVYVIDNKKQIGGVLHEIQSS